MGKQCLSMVGFRLVLGYKLTMSAFRIAVFVLALSAIAYAAGEETSEAPAESVEGFSNESVGKEKGLGYGYGYGHGYPAYGYGHLGYAAHHGYAHGAYHPYAYGYRGYGYAHPSYYGYGYHGYPYHSAPGKPEAEDSEQ